MRSLAPVHTDAEPMPAMAQEAVAAEEASRPLPVDEVEAPAAARRSRATVAATLASVVWLGAAAAAVYLLARFQPPADLTLTGLAGIAAGVTAPLTAIWLIALVLGRATADERRASIARIQAAEARLADVAARTRHELAAIDGVLAAVADRVDTIRGSMGAQAAHMMETAGQLEARSRSISGSRPRGGRAAARSADGRRRTGSDRARRGAGDAAASRGPSEGDRRGAGHQCRRRPAAGIVDRQVDR